MTVTPRALALEAWVDDSDLVERLVESLVARERNRGRRVPVATDLVGRLDLVAAWIGEAEWPGDRTDAHALENVATLREAVRQRDDVVTVVEGEREAAVAEVERLGRIADERLAVIEAGEVERTALAASIERFRGKLRLIVAKLDEAAEVEGLRGSGDMARRKLSEARNIAERAAARLPDGGEG